MRVPMSPCSEGSIRDAAAPGTDRRSPSKLPLRFFKTGSTCAALGHRPTGSISEGAGGPGRVVVSPPAALDLSRRPPQHCGYVIAQCCGPGFNGLP